jgi:hemin uptake protein HemP
VNSHESFIGRRYSPLPETMRPRPQAPAMPPRTLSSESLFEGRTEICIDHGGAIYRLKITRQGKLILNK